MSATYTARHWPDPDGTRDAAGRRQVADPVGPDYNPLRAGVRLRLAPDHWQDPDRYLPAGPDERTGRIDPAAVLAASAPTVAADTAAVLAELRADLDADTDPHGIPTTTREEQA